MSRVVVASVTFLLVFGALTGTAVGDVHETDIETEYNGGSAEADQRVNVTFTVSPTESTLTDIEIRVSERETVIDEGSFEVSVDPDVQLEEVRPGHYRIDELEADQEVAISFVAYPRDIKSEEIDVAVVNYEFFDGGQSSRETITADMSNSPWFQLQNERQTVDEQASTIDQLEQENERLSLVGQLTDVGFIVGLVVGLIGLVAAAVTVRSTSSKLSDQRDRHADKVETLANRASSEEDAGKINQTARDIRSGEIESGGLLDSLIPWMGDDEEEGDTGW
jgi:hypothetical protein